MLISPRFSDRDWKGLSFTREEDWARGVEIFADRIRGRFLKIVESIEQLPFAGFAVLALDCLLVETLQQFRAGLDESPRGHNEAFFVEFLRSTGLGQSFVGRMPNLFYRQVRCGLLHQAEVKGSSRVVITGPLVRLAADGKGVIVNRRKFHGELVRTFDHYVTTLLNGSDTTLRQNFRRKMDYISQVPRTS
jgi:hypothetical protein